MHGGMKYRYEDGHEDKKKWSVVRVVMCMGLCLHENEDKNYEWWDG